MVDANVYDPGDAVELKAEFTDASGSPADPTTVTLYIERPDGSVETVQQGDLTNSTVGEWTYVDTAANDEGRTKYRFVGTGAVQASGQGYYYVRERWAVPSS